MTTLKKLLRSLLLAPVALVLLFEEWGWEPLAACFAALGRLRWWGQLERWIARLPPWGALLVFGLPVLVLIPVKLLAIYLFGRGHFVLGLGLIIAAKLVGTALAARLFQLTHPTLMQLGWFARLYTPWKHWKDKLLGKVRGSGLWRQVRWFKAQAKRWGVRGWMALKSMAN